MITPELVAYIKGEIANGKKRDEIHSALTSGGGWTEEDILEAFREIIPAQGAVVPPAKPIVLPPPVITPAPQTVPFSPPFQSVPIAKDREPVAFKERSAPQAMSRFLKFLTILIIVGALGTTWWFYGTQIKNSFGGKNEKIPSEGAVSQISGNKDDLVFFSVAPGEKVSGKLKVSGTVKGGYFFEANIGVNILDVNKNTLRSGNATASGEWMTAGPVSFETSINFSSLPTGAAFIQIHNDNASGDPKYDKFILIPVVIE